MTVEEKERMQESRGRAGKEMRAEDYEKMKREALAREGRAAERNERERQRLLTEADKAQKAQEGK